MKKFLSKSGAWIVMTILLVLIFVFGTLYSLYMTNQISVHEYEAYLVYYQDASKAEGFDTTAVEASYQIPGTTGDENMFTPTLDRSIKVYSDDEVIGEIYVITSHGNADGLEILVAISTETDSVENIAVLSQNETDDSNRYYGSLTDANFFDQFAGLSFDTPDITLDTVAGATKSCEGFEIAIEYARLQYAADFGFVIPEGNGGAS